MWCIIFIALILSILGITLIWPCYIILLMYCWIQFASILLRLLASIFIKDQFSSVAQSCPTLCDPMGCSTPGFPVHHQHPELTQTHIHTVGDAIQPSHPLLSPYTIKVTISSVQFSAFPHIHETVWPSVQFSCSVMSDSLPPHESQHARPPCPSPTPRVHSDSRPSSQWCHPA